MTIIKQTGASKKYRRQNTGSITSRSKGSWLLRYDVFDSEGNRKQINETVRGTKTYAGEKLKRRIEAVRDGLYVNKNKGTVDHLMARFIDEYCIPPTVRLRTRHGYEGQISRYITPVIGRVQFQGLKTARVRQIYADMLERGLSSTTVLHLDRLLKKIFNRAVEEKLLSEANNPLATVKAPGKSEYEMEMWDIPTIHKFLDLCDQSIYGDLFTLAIHTGLRRSEICGLKWDAIDLGENRLRVVSTLHSINGHGLVSAEPKTKKSRRTVVMAPETVNLFHSIRGRQMEQGLPSTGYVFTRPNGLPLIPQEVTKAFTGFIRKNNLPHMTLHGLRHAYATLGLLAGIDSKVVSESLGHSTITITMDLYSHVMGKMKEAHAQTIANLLKRESQTG